jgi:uncharacterized protein
MSGPSRVSTKEECEICDASRAGQLGLVQELLARGVSANAQDNRSIPWNVTPLMYACEAGHAAIVQILLAAGADINAKDKGIPVI